MDLRSEIPTKDSQTTECSFTGRIIKGIAGFYYVHNEEYGLYECKAKGIFRNKKIKPLVGDIVTVERIDDELKKGNIIQIHERQNELIRPAVANIDQAMVIFAITNPAPNLNLLDRFLVMMEKYNVETVLCFNKLDLVTKEEQETLNDIYSKCGCKVLFVSAKNVEGIQDIIKMMEGKTTVFAGPSGVGKSSIINLISPKANMETGEISEKIKRGKHTTRHSQLFHVIGQTYMMDTPGFTSLYLEDIEKEDLRDYFVEFQKYEEYCRFQGCVHINEPDCAVKEAIQENKISNSRYENYKQIYDELKNRKKY